MSRNLSAIHQFHSGASPGDAITNQMFAIRDELRSIGYVSEIFAEHFDGDLAGQIKHIDSFVPSPNELLLVHHSMGHRRLDQILNFSNPLVTVYHNITPARELDEVGYKHFSHIGRHQLDVLARQSLMGIAVSHYNRKEMLLHGFKDVEVIPVRTDFREFRNAREMRHPERDWLFVGRIAPNKQQLEIVRAFSHFHHTVDKSARLFLVGDHKMRSYVDKVGDEIERLGLVSHIDAPGKIEDSDLIHRYARAGVFISLSTHEGFGVPLLEAMAAGIPVVALESSAVTETMGGAGVLLPTTDPNVVCQAVKRVMVDANYRHEVIWKQDRRLEKLTSFNVREALLRVLEKIEGKKFPLRIQIQGPIETSYSLAILNREAALQLDSSDGYEVSVFPTEGPGDYPPNIELLETIPDLPRLYQRGLTTPYPDVIIRQMFPPRVKDTTAPITLQYFGWEESLVPTEFVEDFNRHVSRIMTMSGFVRDSLRQSGVTVPIDVVGVGVRAPNTRTDATVPGLSDLRSTRLLHISSAFPRKGVDVLLKAYFAEFTDNDDITLVLKTFPNQHNTVEQLLAELRADHQRPPHVVLLNEDLSSEQLGVLYREATGYVHPARGEGFGLPVAEAMLTGVPVISTATSGLAEFVDETTAAVIPSELVASTSHVTVAGSQWFEPDQESLQKEMRLLHSGEQQELRTNRINSAREKIAREFSWKAVGDRIKQSVEAARLGNESIRVTHLTTFNSRCGIAEYSSLLRNGLPQNVKSTVVADRGSWPLDFGIEEEVVRLWEQVRHQDVQPLVTALRLSDSDIIHLQHNYGFFSMEDLSDLVQRLNGAKPLVITLHRTKDLDRGHEIVSLAHATDALRKVHAIIVHEEHDVRRLADFGISGNVVHIPHAAMPFKGTPKNRVFTPGRELRLGTFGFLLPHKGLETSLAALHSLNYRGIPASLTALCSLHPDPTSAQTHERINDMIDRWNLSSLIHLDTGYKTVEEIHTYLSDVDILLLPYAQTEESSSGVLAMLLGVGKPIIATDLDIFSGSRDALKLVPAPAKDDDVTSAIVELINDPAKMRELGRKARQRALDISWGAIGRETFHLYQSLLQK